MAARINLKNTEARIKNLENIGKIVIKIGFLTKLHLVNNWLKGRGGNEKSMKRLSKSYKTSKIKSGRKGIPDLNFTGLMQQSLTVKKSGKTKAFVTFAQAQMKKARHNFSIRKNMMILSKKFKKEMNDKSLKFIQGK